MKQTFPSIIVIFMLWTGLRRVLTLKLTGGIPWLLVVPILAAGIELSYAWFGFGPRLPYSLVLMFLVALVFSMAHGTYAIACPPNLKGIESKDEWSKMTANKRREILQRIEQDKVLKSALLIEAENLIDESLTHAFSGEQIIIIKRELIRGVQGKANFLGESIANVADTSVATFNQLNKTNPLARWTCTVLISASFGLLAAVIILRLLSVYHAALG